LCTIVRINLRNFFELNFLRGTMGLFLDRSVPMALALIVILAMTARDGYGAVVPIRVVPRGSFSSTGSRSSLSSRGGGMSFYGASGSIPIDIDSGAELSSDIPVFKSSPSEPRSYNPKKPKIMFGLRGTRLSPGSTDKETNVS